MLKGFIVPNIEVDGNIYAVDEGIVTLDGTVVPLQEALPVLRTAYFSVANRINPILAFEGTDPEKITSSVAALKGSLGPLSARYDADTREIIASSFYPIPFLESISSLEKARKELLARPTAHNAAVYGVALRYSLAQYRASLKESTAAFVDLGQASADTIYTFLGGTTSLESVRTGLTALDASAQTQQVKAAARLACFEGTGSCESLESLLPEQGETLSAEHPLTALPSPAASIKPLLSSVVRTHATALGYTFDELGIVTLPESFCLPDMSPMYASVWRNAKNDTSMVRFQPLNDLYFYDLREKTQSPFYAHMRKSGVDFLSQGISNLYECADSGLDAAHVVTTYELARIIAAQPLFLPVTTRDAALRKIAKKEEAIIAGPFISENAVQHYIASLSDFIRTKGERTLAEETSPETVLEAERRIALLRSHSALFDEQIETANATNAVLGGISAAAGSPMPLFPLFMSRSYPSLFYGAGNESLVSSPISFLRQREAEPLSKFQMTSYSLLRNTYSDSEILDFLNTSSQAYLNAGIGL
jgi:hypothetical protein